jgi:hypothetical protein
MEVTALKSCYEKVSCQLTEKEMIDLERHHKQSVLQCERYIFIMSLENVVPIVPDKGV